MVCALMKGLSVLVVLVSTAPTAAPSARLPTHARAAENARMKEAHALATVDTTVPTAAPSAPQRIRVLVVGLAVSVEHVLVTSVRLVSTVRLT